MSTGFMSLRKVSLTREAFFAERGHCLQDLLETGTEAADSSDDFRLKSHQHGFICLLATFIDSPGTF